MSRYFHNIINYFFHHQFSEEIVSRVQDRLVHGQDDAGDTMHEIWDELDDKILDENTVEQAYWQTAAKIFPREKFLRKISWLKIAAIWTIPLLLLCGSYYFFTHPRQGSVIKDVAFIHKSTAYGERSYITLPDSSKVWLNGGSTLIYPSLFETGERSVSLSGEAFFDVVKDQRPFIVNVSQVKLKVLGTTFNVYSYPNNPHVIATLETGKILVEIENKKPFVLSPNEQMMLDTVTGEVDIHSVTASNTSAWRTGTLYFEETTFYYAIQQLEHVYNVKIHLLNDQFNNQTIRAHFNSNESIEDIMAVIKMLIPSMEYEIHNKDIFIK